MQKYGKNLLVTFPTLIRILKGCDLMRAVRRELRELTRMRNGLRPDAGAWSEGWARRAGQAARATGVRNLASGVRGGGDDRCVGCKPSAAAGPSFPNTAAAHCGTSVRRWSHGQASPLHRRFQRSFQTFGRFQTQIPIDSNRFQCFPTHSNPFLKKIMRRLRFMFPHSFWRTNSQPRGWMRDFIRVNPS